MRIESADRPWSMVHQYAACCLLWGSVAPATIGICEAMSFRPNRLVAEVLAWPIMAQLVALQWLPVMNLGTLSGGLVEVYDSRAGIAFFILPALLTALWLVLPGITLLLAFGAIGRSFRLCSLSFGAKSAPDSSASTNACQSGGVATAVLLGFGVAISAVLGFVVTAHWLDGIVTEYVAGGLTAGERLGAKVILIGYAKTGLPNSVAPIVLLIGWRWMWRGA